LVDTSTTQDKKKYLQLLSSKGHTIVTPIDFEKEVEVQHLISMLIDLFKSTSLK